MFRFTKIWENSTISIYLEFFRHLKQQRITFWEKRGFGINDGVIGSVRNNRVREWFAWYELSRCANWSLVTGRPPLHFCLDFCSTRFKLIEFRIHSCWEIHSLSEDYVFRIRERDPYDNFEIAQFLIQYFTPRPRRAINGPTISVTSWSHFVCNLSTYTESDRITGKDFRDALLSDSSNWNCFIDFFIILKLPQLSLCDWSFVIVTSSTDSNSLFLCFFAGMTMFS